MTVINIIPSSYTGDPRKALGYAWQSFSTKTPGVDIVVEDTGKGINYMAAARDKMAEMGMTKAYINCMWCGGFDGEITATEEPKAVEQTAPLSAEEVAINEQAQMAENDRSKKGHVGRCNKCHSYCFGDCEA